MTRTARTYAAGRAEGFALVLARPLSFWGGVDAETGRVIDRTHPEHGACVTGRVLIMPAGRGSSSSASVLAESLRRGTGPAAVVLATPDPILTVGSLVAESLYLIRCPIVTCSIAGLENGQRLRVVAEPDGAAIDLLA